MALRRKFSVAFSVANFRPVTPPGSISWGLIIEGSVMLKSPSDKPYYGIIGSPSFDNKPTQIFTLNITVDFLLWRSTAKVNKGALCVRCY